MSWSRRRRVDRTCSIDGCEAPFYAKTWCQRHYYRVRRNGDPFSFRVAQRFDRYDDAGNRWCAKCRTYRLPAEFGRSKPPEWCTECRRLSRYQLTRETYAKLPGADGICPLCRIRSSTEIDHDHTCCPGRDTCGECVRGVLCRPCNVALGTITEEGVLMRAINYIRHGGKAL